MSSPPTGTVTFLFTDIEGSTELAQRYPDAMSALLARHNAILNQAIESHHGFVFRVIGDSFSVAFHTAEDALHAALDAQRVLHNEPWSPAPIKVRMGINTGASRLEIDSKEDPYSGYATLALTQRIMSVGHGGQILLSQSTYDLTRDGLPENAQLVDMGERRLKNILRAERIFQLSAPNLPFDFPPLNTLESFPHNLPVQLTSFIGRERELAEANQRLANARLLTLIGPGGTGKTRLSLQVAADQLSEFKDGVWFIELAPINNPALIVSTIASVFDLREIQNTPLISILVDYLRARQLLLILDNCEHLVEASAEIANQLLHACTNLKIIASSREALGINGETVFRVPSLSLPRQDFRSLQDFGSLMEYEATRLFIERAMKADSRFHVTEHNASAIAQICSRLDGIPLAIELAAARVMLFTPEQIAQRLDDRFKLLTGGSRTALPRQQTLRALIDWSYQSLNETEQRALRQLAVFSGGWSFDGAEAVISQDEVMEGLLGLVNKSLVNVEEQEGESRYRFLETIRQYAMEKLVESGEAVAARDRHLDYVLDLAGQMQQGMLGAENIEALNQLELEHDNLRTALEWASSNHLEKVLKLASAVGGFWAVRDHNSEAVAWCKTILDKTESMVNADRDRARVYGVLGWISVTTGEHKAGRDAAEKAIALAEKSSDVITIARAYSIVALTSIFLGDYSTAQQASMAGESIARQHGLKSELAFALSTRAQMAYFSRRDVQQAKAYIVEAAKLAREAGFGWAASFVAIGLGHTAAILGDLQGARAAFMESARLAKQMGNKRIVYSSQSEFAHILRQRGELDEPLATYKDLLPKWKDLGHRSAIAHELECIAYILIRKEEPERAAALLGAAEALRESIDSVMTQAEQVEYENEVSTLRAGMNEVEFQQSWGRGRDMTMEQAIEFALDGKRE